MKLPLNWLREFVPIELSPERIAERLTMAGLEVDGLTEQGTAPVQVAQIIRVDPHPKADHLKLCQIITGGEAIPIVCGAPNTRIGDRVAFAPEGTTLPNGQTITRAEIRGQLSCGMLCSEAELGLSEDHRGILVLPADAPLGEEVYHFLGLRDTILDIALTANRGDCLSVLGLAREIAALTNVPLPASNVSVQEDGPAIVEQVKVSIADPDLCPRYAARVITQVQVAPSPTWLRWRLEAAGIRAINNLVDVTNYVMLERGQPLHAFDLQALAGAEIIVQRARDTASIRTLDGQERKLVPDDLLICDRDRGIALAGVMGGENSEVQSHTTQVLLESAYFVPETVRRTARRLGLPSEASYRFERGVDPQGTVVALDRAATLLQHLAGGQVSRGVLDVNPIPFEPTQVPLRPKRVSTFLGTPVDEAEIVRCLHTLGATVERMQPDAWRVTVPSHRSDLTLEADLIEEVARIRGYETIPTLLPQAQIGRGMPDLDSIWSKRIRTCLVGCGLSEMLNLSFVPARLNELFPGIMSDTAPAALLNPLSVDGAEMRLSLLGGLVQALQHNLRQGETSVLAFELAKVFWKAPTDAPVQPGQERLVLAGLMYGTLPVVGIQPHGRAIEFPDLKAVLETVFREVGCLPAVEWQRPTATRFLHPGKAALLNLDGTSFGVAGALHPTHRAALDVEHSPWLFELDFATLLQYAQAVRRYQPLPRFPGVVRDFAIVADEDLPVQAVIDAVHALSHPLISSVQLFDLYRGRPIPDNKKSLAYSITYRAEDRTLTADEVNLIHTQVTEHIVRELGVEIRS